VLLAPSVNTLNSFSLLKPFFILKIQQQNTFKIQYLPHLKYENYEINFIKSNSVTTFQQHQVHLWIQVKHFIIFLLNFTNKMVQ
jgi:hypothetical protein